MGFDQSQNESGHAQALPGSEVDHGTRREPRRSVASGASDLQRFGIERFEQRLSEARLRRSQTPWPNQALQPTPWIAVAFPSPLARRG
ncbi:MAG: hypothetical protein MN733_06255 [Nitrososphaera sp.]|nr:hypothetical protein [Nitrososphaera sp.]